MRAVLEDIQVRVWRSYVKIPMIFLAPAMFLVTLYVIVYLAANTAWATRALNAQAPAIVRGEGWVEDVSVSPWLSGVEVWGARLRDRRGAHVFTVEHLDAEIDPLLLLRGTVEVEKGAFTGVDLHLSFERGEERSKINLLDALGLYEGRDEEPEEPEEGGGVDVHLLGLSFTDSTYSMVYPGIFELDAPLMEIPNGEVHIADGNLQMFVPRMQVPRIDFTFYAELFGYDPGEQGDWTFSATDLDLEGWRWANMGFLIEDFTGDVEGYALWMAGKMAFPEEEGMTYEASAVVSAPYRSTLIEYWVGDYIYYEMEHFGIAGAGDLDYVGAGVEINASVVDVYGMMFEDVRAVGGIDGGRFYADEVTGYLAGGSIDLDWAFFEVFEKAYGMQGSFEGIDPAEVLAQMDVEMPSLAGRARGAISMLGEVPPSRPDPLVPEQFWEQATETWVTMEVTEDIVLDRTSRELIPGSRVRILEGSRGFVTRDLAGVTRAELAIGPDRFVATDSVLDYRSYEWVPWRQGVGASVRGRIADLAPYSEFYAEVGASSGPARLDVDLWGPLIHPEIDLRLEAQDMRIDGADVPIDELELSARVRKGRVWLDGARARTGKSVAQVRGWLDALYVWRSDPPEESLPRYRARGRIPARLEIDADGFDLGAVGPLLPGEMGLRGKLRRAKFDLAGTLRAPVVCASVEAVGLLAYGERARRVVFDGGWRAPGARGECSRLEQEVLGEGARVSTLLVDMGDAGVLAGSGRVGADGTIEGSVDGKGLELGALERVRGLGLGIKASGDVSLEVGGTVERPEVSGHVVLERVGAAGTSLGDFVLVVDTLEERYEVPGGDPIVEQTVYMSGALMPPVSRGRESSASLPWLKLEVEVPLDDAAPIYARLGLDSVDVIDLGRGVEIGEAAPALSALGALERLVLTGTVELFVNRDQPGYSVIASLPGLEVGPRELGLVNERPVSVGFVSEEVGGQMRQLVTVEHFSVGSGDQFVTLEGSYSPNDGFVDLSMDGAVRLGLLPSLREVFPGLVPDEIVDAKGLLAVNASVRGEASAPLVTGSVSPRDAVFVLRSLSEPVTLSSGRMDLSSRGARVPESEPIRGGALGGAFEVSGGAAFVSGEDGLSLGALDMKGWSHNMSYSVAQTANLTFDTQLQVRAARALELSTWLVSGGVTLLDGLFYRDISLLEDELTGRVLGAFDRRAELFESSIFERNPELSEVGFDLEITARDSFKIKNQIDRFLLDMELRMALRLSQTLENPRLLGDIEVVDGDVVFQGEQFEVRDGLVRFDGPFDDPFVDVAAAADIRNACDAVADDEQAEPLVGVTSAIEEQDSTNYHITLTVRGRTDQLELVYDSTPYADQRDVISLLLTGCTVDLLTATSASQPTLEIALGPLIGRLEREVQDVVEVEEFTIIPGVERTELRISDNLTRRLSWDFQLDTGFNDNVGSGQTAQLEYKLTDRLAAEVSESTRSASANNTGNFTIDVKLKYRIFLD